ncbi:MAG: VanZ family protein [Planctomycetes bacterium]|nr:VanZ family protein [Planctomycetota bacterium]
MISAGRWLPWMALVLAAAVAMVPGDRLAQWIPEVLTKPGRDEVMHAAGFFILTLCFRGWRGWSAPPMRWIPGAMVILMLFALVHEGLQGWIPGRVLSSGDLVADGSGIVVAVAFCFLLHSPDKV